MDECACKLCNRNFKNLAGLVRHLCRTHGYDLNDGYEDIEGAVDIIDKNGDKSIWEIPKVFQKNGVFQ
jgi:hypothetical protein